MSDLKRIDLDTIKKTAQTLHLQSRRVVEKMLEIMKVQSSDGKIGWDEFRTLLFTVMPNSLEGQITLFLRSYVPQEVQKSDIDNYCFSKADILKICKDCLEPMFKVTDDEFFTQLYTNYADILFKILGMQENTEDKISLRRLKKLICQADGYDRDMLALLYGVTGIMRLDENTEYEELGTKIELHDVSTTSDSMEGDLQEQQNQGRGRNNRNVESVQDANFLVSFQNTAAETMVNKENDK